MDKKYMCGHDGDECEFCDDAHQADMRAVRYEQLKADISPEETAKELADIEHANEMRLMLAMDDDGQPSEGWDGLWDEDDYGYVPTDADFRCTSED